MYPALSVAQTLTSNWRLDARGPFDPHDPRRSQLLWVGSVGGMEAELVARAGLPFVGIHGGGVHGVGWQLPRNAFNLARGCVEALRLIGLYQPDTVFVTGGFITAPVALAAWLRRVPIVMYLPDIEPGLALQFIGRLATRLTATVAESQTFFPGAAKPVLATGYPTRPEFAEASRDKAIPHFGLDPARQTVLITGGSRGARSLNRAVLAALPQWLAQWQVIHLTGPLDWPEAQQAQAQLRAAQRGKYHVFPYLHEMGLALAAADLVVSRAGASCLGEYPLFGLPAVLVPYPYAWRYQKVNADYLTRRGAAVLVKDDDLAAQLDVIVTSLLNDPARLSAMRHAAQTAATPQAARRLAAEIVQLATQ